MKLFQKALQSYQVWKAERQDRWRDLRIGDVLEFDGEHYVYCMLDRNGGPGMAGITEPVFTTEEPTCPRKIFYIRDTADPRFPEHIFGKDEEQTHLDGKTKICWINSYGYRKVGHIDLTV